MPDGLYPRAVLMAEPRAWRLGSPFRGTGRTQLLYIARNDRVAAPTVAETSSKVNGVVSKTTIE